MTAQPRRDDPRALGVFWGESSEFRLKLTLRQHILLRLAYAASESKVSQELFIREDTREHR